MILFKLLCVAPALTMHQEVTCMSGTQQPKSSDPSVMMLSTWQQ
jgi:hypothetical protein